jgi:hypothetical protein
LEVPATDTVIVVVPAATPVITPVELTVAILVPLDVYVGVPNFEVAPIENVPAGSEIEAGPREEELACGIVKAAAPQSMGTLGVLIAVNELVAFVMVK